jgi:hypothetical protein
VVLSFFLPYLQIFMTIFQFLAFFRLNLQAFLVFFWPYLQVFRAFSRPYL